MENFGSLTTFPYNINWPLKCQKSNLLLFKATTTFLISLSLPPPSLSLSPPSISLSPLSLSPLYLSLPSISLFLFLSLPPLSLFLIFLTNTITSVKDRISFILFSDDVTLYGKLHGLINFLKQNVIFFLCSEKLQRTRLSNLTPPKLKKKVTSRVQKGRHLPFPRFLGYKKFFLVSRKKESKELHRVHQERHRGYKKTAPPISQITSPSSRCWRRPDFSLSSFTSASRPSWWSWESSFAWLPSENRSASDDSTSKPCSESLRWVVSQILDPSNLFKCQFPNLT